MELVAFLGEDKETWGQVTALINRFDCDKAILVKDKNSEEFPANGKCKIIEIDSSIPLANLKSDIQNKLKQELSRDFEVALSINIYASSCEALLLSAVK